MPGPDGIITVYGSFRKAKECEDGEAAFAEAVFFGEEFKEIHAATDPAEMLASKQEVSASPPTFKPTVDIKQVELVAGDAAKTTSMLLPSLFPFIPLSIYDADVTYGQLLHLA
jgi:hypothetical protein